MDEKRLDNEDDLHDYCELKCDFLPLQLVSRTDRVREQDHRVELWQRCRRPVRRPDQGPSAQSGLSAVRTPARANGRRPLRERRLANGAHITLQHLRRSIGCAVC